MNIIERINTLLESTAKTSIWAWRFSSGHGAQWVKERDCDQSDAEQWLKVFRKDEPKIEFVASQKKPKPSKNDIRPKI